MIEVQPAVEERAMATRNRAAGLIKGAKYASAVALASLGFGFGASGAEARAPAQVQEYAKLVVKNPTGATLARVPGRTFMFVEQCKAGSREVKRKIIARMGNQALGKCNIGSPVTVTAKRPLKGSWTSETPVKQRLAKATRSNNHHIRFVERAKATSTSPSPNPSSPSPAPAPNPSPTPSPSPGGGGGSGGGGTPNVLYSPGQIGADISWPQCQGPGNSMAGNVGNFDFGIVGIQGGLAYSANPCLASEVADFTSTGKPVGFYVNTGWNDTSSHINPNSPRSCATGDKVCLAYNYGWGNAVSAVQTAESAGFSIDGKEVEEDIETDNTWSQGEANSAQQNAASLQGTADGLKANGASRVLLYFNLDGFNTVLGNQPNGQETWLATGASTSAEAASYCSDNLNGPVRLVQFHGEAANGMSIDANYAC